MSTVALDCVQSSHADPGGTSAPAPHQHTPHPRLHPHSHPLPCCPCPCPHYHYYYSPHSRRRLSCVSWQYHSEEIHHLACVSFPCPSYLNRRRVRTLTRNLVPVMVEGRSKDLPLKLAGDPIGGVAHRDQ